MTEGNSRHPAAVGRPRVCVMMSVYNGSSYLREQVASILDQEDVDIHLFVRDDGSTDDTTAILASYGERVEVLEGDNKGAAQGFIEAAFAAPRGFDYYAFSDADDVWLEQKMAAAIALIAGRTEPTVYASSLRLVDRSLRDLNVTTKTSGPLCFTHALAQGGIGGATCVMNAALFALVREQKPTRVAMHDNWVYLIASAFGSVVFDDRSFILYRQHGSNTVGGSNSFRTRWTRRMNSIRVQSQLQLMQAKEFRRIHGSKLRPNERRILNRYADLDKSLAHRLRFSAMNGLTYHSFASRVFNSAIALFIPRTQP